MHISKINLENLEKQIQEEDDSGKYCNVKGYPVKLTIWHNFYIWANRRNRDK